ncbi:MAG: hypothetical protein HZC41_24980 [Chloroflexi bacterium]|nr:hypothetical protein [Chloroflexota bacterium]
MSKRTKPTFPFYEPGEWVELSRPILRYGDAARGIKYDPPLVLFPVGTRAQVLKEQNTNLYTLSLADGTFIISRHASSITKASGDNGNA